MIKHLNRCQYIESRESPRSQPCRPWAPSQYPKRRLFVRSRKVSKRRDWYFKLPYRFEIWQAHRQHCCRSACQISERSDNFKYKSRGFETLRDLTERRLFGYWDGALVAPQAVNSGGIHRSPGGFPSKRVSNAENISISWRHHVEEYQPSVKSPGRTCKMQWAHQRKKRNKWKCNLNKLCP